MGKRFCFIFRLVAPMSLAVVPLLAAVTAQAAPTTQVRAYLVQRHHNVQSLFKFMESTNFPQNELDGPFHPIELFSPRTTYLRWTVRFPMNVSANSSGQLKLQPETSVPSAPSSPPNTSSPSSGETVTITQNQTYNGQEWTTTATWQYESSGSGMSEEGSWQLTSWSAVWDNVPTAPHHGGTLNQ